MDWLELGFLKSRLVVVDEDFEIELVELEFEEEEDDERIDDGEVQI